MADARAGVDTGITENASITNAMELTATDAVATPASLVHMLRGRSTPSLLGTRPHDETHSNKDSLLLDH